MLSTGAAVLLAAPAVAHGAIPASFGAASYAPGQFAYLHVDSPPRTYTVQVLRAGLGDGLGLAPVESPWQAHGATIAVHVWSWPSGVYFARVSGPGGRGLAPFVLRPARLGASRVAVIEPAYTWQAYNDFAGGSWYFGGPDTVQLARPYLDGGVPPHFAGYDVGFLRWLVRTGRIPCLARTGHDHEARPLA